MRRWYPPLIVVAMFAVSIVAYPRLPDRVPTHWNAHGEVNGYGTKTIVLFLMPGLLGLMFAIIGGYLMVGAGVVGFASSALPFFAGFTAVGVAVAIAAIGSVVYSYVAWRQEKSK
jgi:uncharacterized membrane protein